MMQMESAAKVSDGWKEIIEREAVKPYFSHLEAFLKDEYACKTVYPPREKIFAAFCKAPFNDTKVVILGQDPYHGKDQATGLAFAVSKGVKEPPSLKNILKEVASEYGEEPESRDLENWASQGVLLLNTVLTVTEGAPESHRGRGWETFTDEVIKAVSDMQSHAVFMLWGRNAFEKEKLIDNSKHLVLKAPHPSPLSAHRGYFGCGHFKAANEFLKKYGLKEIDWLS